MSKYSAALKYKIYNRGVATDDFLDKLIAWTKKTLSEKPSIFEVNPYYDAFSSMRPELGPWKSTAHRAGALANYLTCLAAYESSFDWNCGRDTTNSNEDTLWNEESGIFQTSADAMYLGKELQDCYELHSGNLFSHSSNTAKKFIEMSKDETKPDFIFEITALVLRKTIRHHGPALRKEINKWLRRSAVEAFEKLLSGDANIYIDSETPWLDLARSYIGQKEIAGNADNEWIEDCFNFTSYGHADHDEVPWCAAFICRCLSESSYKHTHSALAASYKSYGEACDLKPGAIIVFRWAAGNRHVTFLDHVIDSKYVACLGGNQNNAVKISNYERKYIEAVRWPVKS